MSRAAPTLAYANGVACGAVKPAQPAGAVKPAEPAEPAEPAGVVEKLNEKIISKRVDKPQKKWYN